MYRARGTTLLALLVGAVVLSTAARAEEDRPLAPDLGLEHLINAPAGELPAWGNLRGKLVLLEFWFTTCPPCIDAMPHLSQLIEEVDDPRFQVISITFEEPGAVWRFMQDHDVPGWVGLDTDRSVIKAYDILSYPTSVLVDPEGRVLGEADSRHFDARHIRAFLDGNPKPIANHIAIEEERMAPIRAKIRARHAGNPEPLEPAEPEGFEMVLRPSTGKPGSHGALGGMQVIRGRHLTTLITVATSLPYSRFRGETDLGDTEYDLEYGNPGEHFMTRWHDHDTEAALIAAALKVRFGITFEKGTERGEAVAFTSPPTPGADEPGFDPEALLLFGGLRSGGTMMMSHAAREALNRRCPDRRGSFGIDWQDDRIVMRPATLRMLAQALEHRFGVTMVVSDEDERFIVATVETRTDDLDAILAALERDLGVTAERGEREYGVVRVAIDDRGRARLLADEAAAAAQARR